MYNTMLKKFRNGEITEAQWQKYCFARLINMLNKNIDVFTRLRNR